MNKYKLYGSLLRHFMLGLYTVEGEFEGNKMQALIADDGSTLDYIAQVIFPSGASIAKKGRISALDAPKLANSHADLVIVGANRLMTDRYMRRGFRIIPKWIRLHLPVEEDPYTRLRAFGRPVWKYFGWMLNKIKDAGFECEVVDDNSWFSLFYEKMYSPYTIRRFGEDAVLYKPHILEKYYSKGDIVIVKKNGAPVAGGIVFRTGDILHFPFEGITGGNLELVKEGAMFALHYYLAVLAHSRGCASIDFGLCRPFLSDGTLVYKLNWRMDVLPFNDVANEIALATPNSTPQAMKFLAANPHFLWNGNEFTRSDKKVNGG